MEGKAFFIDTTQCIGCRACQIACKQWNQLPATTTENRGGFQNPEDLSFYTYKLLRFSEHEGEAGKPVWYFFPDQCRHCLEPPCKEIPEDPDAIIIDQLTGAVLYTDRLKQESSQDVRDSCPYDIPRAEKGTGYMAKCTMCVDRVHNGLLPACVKTCPTGAMNFGDRGEMVALAEKRLKEVKSKFPKAVVTGLEDVRVFYLLADEPVKYYEYAQATVTPMGIDRKTALKRIARPLRELSREWQMLKGLAG
jgi:formate dehydrogenase iron-sulfur subunit